MRQNISAIVGLLAVVAIVILLDRPLGSIPALGPLLSPSEGFLQNRESAKDLSDQSLPPILEDSTSIVVFDSLLIPHIFASNDEDAFRLQGFIEAKYRIWQMDFITRVAAGRVSEVVGPRAIDFDIKQRRKGMARAAEVSVAKWEESYPESYSNVQAYVDGVNAYIDQLQPKDYPIEYKIMGYAPERWSALKSALFFKHMADVLCSREADFELTNARKILGPKIFDQLYPDKILTPEPVIPIEKVYDFGQMDQQTGVEAFEQPMIGLYDERPFEHYPSGIGSNNWAVSPSKVKSGHALMANDPHLPLRLPSIWYLVHIKTPEYNVFGVSFPGIMGVILGFNENISWGVTNVGHDVLDWLEVLWDPKNSTYTWDSTEQKVDWRIEEIKVKGEDPVIDSVAWTAYGPIWNITSAEGATSAIMRWAAHDVPERDEMSVFPGLNRATSLKEAAAAVQGLHSPAQNFVMASRNGDIGMRVQGKLPLRPKGSGRMISPAGSRYTWQEFIPQDQVPEIYNPRQAYVASANQASTDSTYPYYYINGDFRDARALTINQTLRNGKDLSKKDMMALQLNNYDIEAHSFIKTIIDLVPESTERSLLETWDGMYNAQCKTCILVEILKEEIQELVYDELQDGDLEFKLPSLWRLMELIESDKKHKIFDLRTTPEQEGFESLLHIAWEKSVSEWQSLGDIEWYQYRKSSIPHIVEAFSSFGAHNITAGGTGKAPNALRKSEGPSWRLVVELGEKMDAMGVYPGGQSGHAGSKYYDNMLEAWQNGTYYPLNLSQEPSEIKGAVFTMKSETIDAD